MQYQDVDISPSNIWPAPPGGTAADPNHLYLNNPNLGEAIKKQIQNFVYATDGAINIDVAVSVSSGIFIITKNKHNPSGSWWGLRAPKITVPSPYTFSEIRFYFPSVGYTTPPSTVSYLASGTSVYNSHSFTNDCNQTSDIVVEGLIYPDINFAASDLNMTVLNSPLPLWSYNLNTNTLNTNLLVENVPSCFKTNLIPIVSSTYPWSVTWYNPSGVSVGSGSVTLNNPVSGNYKAVLTLTGTGCTLEKTIKI